MDGQLTKVKKSLENESTKVSKLSADLEQAISDSHKKVELLEQKEQGMFECLFLQYRLRVFLLNI